MTQPASLEYRDTQVPVPGECRCRGSDIRFFGVADQASVKPGPETWVPGLRYCDF